MPPPRVPRVPRSISEAQRDKDFLPDAVYLATMFGEMRVTAEVLTHKMEQLAAQSQQNGEIVHRLWNDYQQRLGRDRFLMGMIGTGWGLSLIALAVAFIHR